ncbi:sulfotransferase [Corallincola luteus]|uniref:Sulfotransferase n=1 Tax=Corallincola luteus TaxID=1775177 RepID=A0ABY2AMM8_9GAMM|nr:sulfotransferase [Corallincola luteus]TCI04451.1 sulfotransferase [Corallincola luteus]
MEKKHLLIVGAPRSGTTMLASMIGAHPDIAVAIETSDMAFCRIVGKAVVGNKLCIPNQLDFAEQLGFNRRYRWRRMLRSVWQTVTLSDTPPDEFFAGSAYPLEKYLALPNLHVIGIIRHADDVISSMLKRGGITEEKARHRWSRAIEIMSALNDKAEHNLIIDYNELLFSPGKQMDRVAEFLGQEPSASMAEGYLANPIYPDQKGIDTSKARDMHSGSKFGIDSKSPNVWRKFLNLHKLSAD